MAEGNNETSNDSIALDLPISLLYDFAISACAARDVKSLMTHFFNILRTEVDFDMAAFLLHTELFTQTRVYSSSNVEKAKIKDFSGVFLKRASSHFDNFDTNRVEGLGEHSILLKRKFEQAKPVAKRLSQVSSIELPLKCWGTTSAIVTLVSYSSPDLLKGKANLINTLATDLSRALERLIAFKEKEEKKLSNILHTMSEGVFLIDADRRLNAVNPKSVEIISNFCKRHIECIKRDFGLGKQVLKSGSSCALATLFSTTSQFLASTSCAEQKEEIKNEDGRILTLSISPVSIEDGPRSGVVVRVKDITDERLTHKGILLASKLASLGEMAAGIAHEINNPLQTILGNLEMLEVSSSDEDLERVEKVKDGVLRIRDTVKDLLMFAREQTTETENVDINDVLDSALKIIQPHITRAGLEIHKDLDTKPLTVKCNGNLLQQVIINLLQNAKDAIEESRKGSAITIRSTLMPEREIIIEIIDNGPGIAGNIIDRIFEPLFTTKEIGKGTGLGLSLSKKIISGFGGSIGVTSSRKDGTRFRITLPHHGRVMGIKDINAVIEPDYKRLVDKSVLMVDDEEEILSTTRAAVAKNVFTIETVSTGQEALERLKGRDYDFVFLDIRMPKMDGIKLYRNIIEYKPYLAERIIFLTGDVDNKRTAEFLRLTRSRYLTKPFGMKALLTAMYEIDKKVESLSRLGI